MNTLFGEASGLMNNGMMENMVGMFGNMMGANPGGGGQMPDLSNMLNMLGEQAQPTPPPQQQQQQQQSQSKSKKSNNHDPEVVRERLRKKLDSKK